MKYLNYIAVLFFTASLSGQTIKSKKDIVYADDKPAFSCSKKSMGNEMYVYKLNTQEELFHMQVDNNGTESKVDDGIKLIFSQPSTTIQSKTFRGKTWDFLISLLLQEKVINLNGEINTDALTRFKARFDDGNINHTNRY